MSLNHWLSSDQEKETIPQTQLATAECVSQNICKNRN